MYCRETAPDPDNLHWLASSLVRFLRTWVRIPGGTRLGANASGRPWVSYTASTFYTLKIFKGNFMRHVWGRPTWCWLNIRTFFHIRRNLSLHITLHPTPSKFLCIWGEQTKKLLIHNKYYTSIKIILCLTCRYENLCHNIKKKKGPIRRCVTQNNFERKPYTNLRKLINHCMDLSRAESTWCLMFSRSCSIAVSSLQPKQKQTVQIAFLI